MSHTASSINRQSGFGLIEILLLVIVVGVLGGTGWYAWHSKNQTDKILGEASNTVQATKLSVTSGIAKIKDESSSYNSWLTYSDNYLTFKYPSDWHPTAAEIGGDSTQPLDYVSLGLPGQYGMEPGDFFGGNQDLSLSAQPYTIPDYPSGTVSVVKTANVNVAGQTGTKYITISKSSLVSKSYDSTTYDYYLPSTISKQGLYLNVSYSSPIPNAPLERDLDLLVKSIQLK